MLGELFVSLPRLRAPAENGGMLAVPPLAEAGELIASNQKVLQRISTANSDVRREIAQQLIDDPVRHGAAQLYVVGGHQPELFHPGVWLKNFAIQRLAVDCSATPINIVVDNDTLKSPSIRVPLGVGSSSPTDVRLTTLAFDIAGGEVPFEERPIRDQATFESFGDRLAEATRDWPFEPMGVRFWPRVVAQAARTDNLGECLAAARRCVEREWGVINGEVPTSRLANTATFRSFAATVLTDLVAFHTAYNTCVAEFRRTHHIRSRNHPVPDLGRDGDWLETPFWGWRAGAERRGRLFARRTGRHIELRAAGEAWTEVASDGISDGLQLLEAQEYKLRPRALTLTMYVRLFLADLFVHGIGGGKYDELTDAIIARYFHLSPPAYLVFTGTLRIPFDGYDSKVDDLHRLKRLARDLRWNPQRYLHPGQGRESLLNRHRELQTANPIQGDERRDRYLKLREVKERLTLPVSVQLAEVEARIAIANAEVAANAVLRRRDYSFVLFPMDALRDWLTSVAVPPTWTPHPVQL